MTRPSMNQDFKRAALATGVTALAVGGIAINMANPATTFLDSTELKYAAIASCAAVAIGAAFYAGKYFKRFCDSDSASGIRQGPEDEHATWFRPGPKRKEVQTSWKP